jgi:hypothetical protein
LLPALETLDHSGAVLIDSKDLPHHLFGIPDLDLSEDLCAQPLAGPWFRLGVCGTCSGWFGVAIQRYVNRSSSSGYRAPCIEIFDAAVALYLNRRLLYHFSWTNVYFVAFNSQWQSASEVDWALPLAREEVVRPCTDQPELWTVYDLSAVPGAN